VAAAAPGPEDALAAADAEDEAEEVEPVDDEDIDFDVPELVRLEAPHALPLLAAGAGSPHPPRRRIETTVSFSIRQIRFG